MLKKLLTILILGIMVFSVIPTDAFCEDHHDATEHHHGIVLCHGACHGAVLINDNLNPSPVLPDTVVSLILENSLIHEAPVLPTEYRPPITLS